MDNLNLEKYLSIVNEEKEKKGLTNYIPLYPMLRVENGKLYVGVLITKEDDRVWDRENPVKPCYWAIIDIGNDQLVEFNKTLDKDYVIGALIEKKLDKKQQEISKYTIEKTLQYKNYLIEDIKNAKLPIQKKLVDVLGEEIEIDGETVNINEYLVANLEDDIKEKIDELVNMLVKSKYDSITFYYDNLLKQIIKNYKNNKKINTEEIKLCSEIMSDYYDGVIGIDNFFNA